MKRGDRVVVIATDDRGKVVGVSFVGRILVQLDDGRGKAYDPEDVRPETADDRA